MRAVGFFFFKQKTAYEILRSDWSSDVCSSDLGDRLPEFAQRLFASVSHRPHYGENLLPVDLHTAFGERVFGVGGEFPQGADRKQERYAPRGQRVAVAERHRLEIALGIGEERLGMAGGPAHDLGSRIAAF